MPKQATVRASSDMSSLEKVLEKIDEQEFKEDRQVSFLINEAIREAGLGAVSSGLAATVNITLKIKPGPERRLTFTALVKANIPRPSAPNITLFTDDDGNLHGSDPTQMTLKMNEDPTPKRKTEDN